MPNIVEQKLNPYLSDLVINFIKLHDIHWKVKGATFVQVHLYTEARYDDMALKFDEVAEKIIMRGGQPVSTIAEYLELATIKEAGEKFYNDTDALKIVLEDLKHLMAEAQQIRAELDEAGEPSAVATLDEHIISYEKEIWFLSSSLA